MEYITVRQAANKWNRSEHWVQTICQNGAWKEYFSQHGLIPANAKFPENRRERENKRGQKHA